jgi:hypothetical protein
VSDLVQLIQEADFAIMEIERSRAAVDAAKLALESAKEDFERARSAFDQVIAGADALAVPRAKLKKLAEERAAALLASGLFSTPVNQAKAVKAPKAPKKKAPKSDERSDEAFEETPAHLDA